MFLDFFRLYVFGLQRLIFKHEKHKTNEKFVSSMISCSEKNFATSRLCVLIEKALLKHNLARTIATMVLFVIDNAELTWSNTVDRLCRLYKICSITYI